jgi:hypothetical protein
MGSRERPRAELASLLGDLLHRLTPPLGPLAGAREAARALPPPTRRGQAHDRRPFAGRARLLLRRPSAGVDL